jgi:aspartate dehydrogenase
MTDTAPVYPPLNVALIGFGAIGSEVFRRARDLPDVRLRQVLARPGRIAHVQTQIGTEAQAISDVAHLSNSIDIVLEVAGHGALASHGMEVLDQGVDLCVASVGALADDTLRARLSEVARRGRARVHVLSGAIGGIDALAAAGLDRLSEVIYTGRKPPGAWAGTAEYERMALADSTGETVIFDGSAREAALRFPKNANVVATVALAGLGLDETRARLICDANALGNSHHIAARGSLVDLDYTTRGKPLPSNPRTSALTVLSALRGLRNGAGPIAI